MQNKSNEQKCLVYFMKAAQITFWSRCNEIKGGKKILNNDIEANFWKPMRKLFLWLSQDPNPLAL